MPRYLVSGDVLKAFAVEVELDEKDAENNDAIIKAVAKELDVLDSLRHDIDISIDYIEPLEDDG